MLRLQHVVTLVHLAACGAPAPKPTAAPPPGVAAARCEPKLGVELVTNGSFEQPELTDGEWQVLSELPGWRTSLGPGIEVQRRAAGSPHHGHALVELDSHASSGLFQDLQTRSGATYVVSFALSARPGIAAEDNAARVLWDGALVETLARPATDADTEWQVFTFELRADGGSTRLEIQDAGPSNSLGAYLDSVSVREKRECT